MQILLQLINVMSCGTHNVDKYANEHHNISYAEIRRALDLHSNKFTQACTAMTL